MLRSKQLISLIFKPGQKYSLSQHVNNILLMHVQLPSHDLQHVSALVQQEYGFEGQLSSLYGFSDHNYLLKSSEHLKYIVKISSHKEPHNLLVIQNLVLSNIQKHPIETPCEFPVLLPSKQGEAMVEVTINSMTEYLRVFKYIEGTLMSIVLPMHYELKKQAVRNVAHLSKRLQQLTQTQPAVQQLLKGQIGIQSDANLVNFEAFYQNHIKYVPADLMSMVEKAKADFYALLPLLKTTPKQLVHNDAVPHNFLVRQGQVTGLIDFGGMIYTHRVQELAVFLANTVDFEQPLQTVASLTREFMLIQPLTQQECSVLLTLVRTRMAFIVLVQCSIGNDDPVATKSAPYFTHSLHLLQQHTNSDLVELLQRKE